MNWLHTPLLLDPYIKCLDLVTCLKKMNIFQLGLPALVPLGQVIRSALLVATLMLANFFLPLLLSEKLPSFISPLGLVVKFFDWLYTIDTGVWKLYILATALMVALGAWSVVSFARSSRTNEWYVKIGRALIMVLVVAKMYSVFVFSDKLFAATFEGQDANLTVILFLAYKHLVMMRVIPDIVSRAIRFFRQFVQWTMIAGAMAVVVVLGKLGIIMWLLVSELLLVALTEFVKEKVQDDMYNTFVQACVNIDTDKLSDWLDAVMQWLDEPTDATLAETLRDTIRATRQTVASVNTYMQVARRALCIGEKWMNRKFVLTYRAIMLFYLLFAAFHNNIGFVVACIVVTSIVHLTTDNLAQVSVHPVPQVIIDSVIQASNVVRIANQMMLAASATRIGVNIAPAVFAGLQNAGVAVRDAVGDTVTRASVWVRSWW